MSYLEIEGLSHSFGDTVLFRNAEMVLNRGEHIGIVGQNGVGKSTLIKFCTGQLIPDQGTVLWQPGVSIGYLDQYAEADEGFAMGEFLRSAFKTLFSLERGLEGGSRKGGCGAVERLSRPPGL